MFGKFMYFQLEEHIYVEERGFTIIGKPSFIFFLRDYFLIPNSLMMARYLSISTSIR